MFPFDRHSVNRLQDPHRRMIRKQTDHHAVVTRIQMLDDDEGHARACRQGVQQFFAGVEAAGRRADCNNRETCRGVVRDLPSNSTRSRRLGLMRTASRHSGVSEGALEWERGAIQ